MLRECEVEIEGGDGSGSVDPGAGGADGAGVREEEAFFAPSEEGWEAVSGGGRGSG